MLVTELGELEGVTLVGFDLDRQVETMALTVTVYAVEGVPEEAAERLADSITEEVGQEVTLRLIAIPVLEMRVP